MSSSLIQCRRSSVWKSPHFCVCVSDKKVKLGVQGIRHQIMKRIICSYNICIALLRSYSRYMTSRKHSHSTLSCSRYAPLILYNNARDVSLQGNFTEHRYRTCPMSSVWKCLHFQSSSIIQCRRSSVWKCPHFCVCASDKTVTLGVQGIRHQIMMRIICSNNICIALLRSYRGIWPLWNTLIILWVARGMPQWSCNSARGLWPLGNFTEQRYRTCAMSSV